MNANSRSRPPSSNHAARSFLSIVPAVLFWPRADDDPELVGCLARYSARAASLFFYLAARMDQESSRIRGGISQWSRATEHGRDPKTVRLALLELLGEGERPDGSRWALLERVTEEGEAYVRPVEAYWIERCRIRGKRNRNEGGSAAWVQYRSSLIEGGPWQALTDSARKLFLFLRAMAPEQTRKTKDGKHRAANRIERGELAERSQLPSRTISSALAELERLRLVTVRRLRRSGRFAANLYAVAQKLSPKVLGQRVNLSHNVEDQLGGRSPRLRHRLVRYWYQIAGRKPPARVRCALA